MGQYLQKVMTQNEKHAKTQKTQKSPKTKIKILVFYVKTFEPIKILTF